jgi:phosphohistidine phosphatase
LNKKGKKALKTMGSYLKLRGVKPDHVLSSCAVRAQETTDGLMKILEYNGRIDYLQELYFTPVETLMELLKMQDNDDKVIFVIGHNPQLTDAANLLIDDHIGKIPSLGIVAIDFDIDDWGELESKKGEIDFFIYPKQFKYYVPKQIRAVLEMQPDIE